VLVLCAAVFMAVLENSNSALCVENPAASYSVQYQLTVPTFETRRYWSTLSFLELLAWWCSSWNYSIIGNPVCGAYNNGEEKWSCRVGKTSLLVLVVVVHHTT
jgi:hypothetical protein